MEKLTSEHTIEYAVAKSGLTDFTGEFTPLGGGEVNDSYLLELSSSRAVLRVARDTGIDTLQNEAKALSLLNMTQVPRLLYFDKNDLIKGRNWILESYLPGINVDRLTIPQFKELGSLLAHVHNDTVSDDKGVDAWSVFINSCRLFGDVAFLLSHPDKRLKFALGNSVAIFRQQKAAMANVNPALIHSDATPSNILVSQDRVNLIDWEFAKYSDPMAEFSTIFYEDMEYNQGKWRIKIDESEKEALYEGYEEAGGIINTDRIAFWMMVDKVGTAVFLYWRLHESGRQLTSDQIGQYEKDYDSLLTSLEAYFELGSESSSV